MRRAGLMLAAVLVAVLGSNAWGADDTILWKYVGDWTIRIDQTMNYGCFMLGTYRQGEALRVGFDRQSENGYIMIGNDAWGTLRVGNNYDLVLQFDGATPWHGVAKAISVGSTFLYLPFDKPEVFEEFKHAQVLRIYYNNNLVSTLPLTGTHAAVNELVSCQQNVERVRNQGSDPFAK